MRATLTLSALMLGVALASCAEQTEAVAIPCEPPAGCVRSGLVAAACQCLEWQLVSIEPVPVRFMVVGVIYSPLGNQSRFCYGHTGSAFLPVASSDFGSRWRSVIRAADGTERVAALGPGDLGVYLMFGPLVPITSSSAALAMQSNVAIATSASFDVNSHEVDQIFVWINPAAAVTTNYAGEKSVSWSWTASCSYPEGCRGATIFPFLVGWLDGTLPAPQNPYLRAMLDAFDPADRAAIVKYDPFFDPRGRDPATIVGDPRFERLGAAVFDPGSPVTTVGFSWVPCAGTLTDDGFQALAQAEAPFGARETLVVQYSVLSTDAACVSQSPGLEIGSTTSGCSFGADMLVDRLFGTLLMVPTSIGPTCTVGP